MASLHKKFETIGEVTESLPNNQYRVRLRNGRMLLCSIIYRMTRRRIKVVPGDSVTVEVIPSDLARGRIVYRGPRQGPGEPKPGRKRKR